MSVEHREIIDRFVSPEEVSASLGLSEQLTDADQHVAVGAVVLNRAQFVVEEAAAVRRGKLVSERLSLVSQRQEIDEQIAVIDTLLEDPTVVKPIRTTEPAKFSELTEARLASLHPFSVVTPKTGKTNPIGKQVLSVLSPAAKSAGRGNRLGALIEGHENGSQPLDGVEIHRRKDGSVSAVTITSPRDFIRSSTTYPGMREAVTDNNIKVLMKFQQVDVDEELIMKGQFERQGHEFADRDTFIEFAKYHDLIGSMITIGSPDNHMRTRYNSLAQKSSWSKRGWDRDCPDDAPEFPFVSDRFMDVTQLKLFLSWAFDGKDLRTVYKNELRGYNKNIIEVLGLSKQDADFMTILCSFVDSYTGIEEGEQGLEGRFIEMLHQYRRPLHAS